MGHIWVYLAKHMQAVEIAIELFPTGLFRFLQLCGLKTGRGQIVLPPDASLCNVMLCLARSMPADSYS